MVDVELHGGFVIRSIAETQGLKNVAGNRALAGTSTVGGREMYITLESGQSAEQASISLYHEVLEAAAVARSPVALIEFGEAEFEAAAMRFHSKFGQASAENLSQMLREMGF